MSLVYRLLGLAAAIGNRLARIRVNFLPLHWVAMAVLAVAVVLGTKAVRDALTNDREPRTTTVAELLDHLDVDHNFVRVSGTLVEAALFEDVQSRRGQQTVSASYLPLLDPSAKRALLVKRKGANGGRGDQREVTLVGMVQTLDSSVRKAVDEAGGNVDDVAIDREFMLVFGDRPGDPIVWTTLTVAAAVLLLAMLLTWQRRYVVFHPHAAAEPSSGEPIEHRVPADLRASGPFVLPGKPAKRFLAVPAGVAMLDSGNVALLANIDASSRLFGFKLADRSGIWAIEIPQAALGDIEPGYQYLGWRRRPAIRIPHLDPRGKPATAVVSCATERDVRSLVSVLANAVAGHLPTEGAPGA